MTGADLVADLLALSAQIACVVVVAGVMASVIHIDTAAVRYQYWRAVLVLCLLLPWLQRRPMSASNMAALPPISFPTTAIVVSPVASAAQVAAGIPWLEIVVWIVVAGIVFRFARLGLGLMRLRGVRRSGCLAPASTEHDDLQWALRTDAEIRYVTEGQPVTCGVWRPVVLLPVNLLSHPPAIQRAVLVHELLHVQRRDWLWVMGEEVLRAVLWFHPAIWWLVARVRLAREEAVDELTVLATGQRRAYLEALLAFADPAPYVPSAAFARRKHLFHRMMMISKEAVMSSKRVVVSCAVLALAVIAGSWYSVGAFPMTQARTARPRGALLLQTAAGALLQTAAQAPGVVQPPPRPAAGVNEPGPLERKAKPITPENPIPRRTFSVAPQYPTGADSELVMVTLRVTLDSQGRVAEVRSVGGGRGGRMAGAVAGPGGGRGTPTGVVGGPAPPSEAFAKAAADAIRQWIYDPPADAPIAFDVSLAFTPGSEARLVSHGGSVGGLGSGGPGFVTAGVVGGIVGGVPGGVVPPGTATPPPPGWAQGAVRVGGQMRQPTKTKHVNPEYPAIAQSAKVQGVVIIEAIIGTNGQVQDARILRSIPLLDQAAIDAVKQWEFTPTLLNGQPVPVIMTTTVQFSLQ